MGRLAGLLLVLAVALVALTALLPTAPGSSNQSPILGLTSGRDPYVWPFASDSIWNLPIGASASYVAGHIKQANSAGMTTDPDVILLTPTAPSTAVYQNNDGWSGGSRCNPQGGVLFNGPIPSDFVVPGATPSSTPNYATAILMPDNHTLAQGQPMARCTAGNPATMMWYNENEDLYGLGVSGGHGGSMLSSIGGTIRLGELVPGGVIRHALKVNLYGHDDYFYDSTTKGYRWPATTADSYASGVYGGTVPALRMGSLLALPPGLNVSAMGLETQPAHILAQAFQDYGAYTVDDTGWSVYAIETEFSPNGHVEDEFQQVWGFSMTPSSKNTAWARDMDRIFGNLSVVDNWNQAGWATVAASNGTQGAGGGAPRVPWAPPLGSSSPPPPPPPPANRVTVQTPTSGEQVSPGAQITIAWNSSGSLQPASAALSYSADGGATWTLPFATGQPLNGSLPWNVPNATTNQATVRVVVKDSGGNDVEGRSGQFLIGSAPPGGFPVARLAYTPTWPRPNTTITFDASASTPSVPSGSLEARWDWQNDGIWDTSWSPTLVMPHAYGAEGDVVVHLQVREASGAEDNATASVVVDGTPPVTTATVAGMLGHGGWYVSNVTISLAATDAGSGVASTVFRADGGSWQSYSAGFGVGNGEHEIDFYSVDRAGVAETERALRLQVDSSRPTFNSVSPSGVVSTSDVLISWNAADAFPSPIEYATSVDGGPFINRGTNTSLSLVLTDGDHWVLVRATDASGNLAETTISFRVDTNPLSFTGPYRGGPTIVALLAALLLLGFAAMRRRRKRRHSPIGSVAYARPKPYATPSSARKDFTSASRTRNS